MASGTIDFTQSDSSGKYIDGKIEWSSTKNDAGNYSLVDADIYVKKGSTTTTLTEATSGTWSYALAIDTITIECEPGAKLDMSAGLHTPTKE